MAYERDIKKEQKSLQELLATGGFKEEDIKTPGMEENIRRKTYGTSRPTFRKDYGIDEMEKKIDEATGKYEQRRAGAGKYAGQYEKNLRSAIPELAGQRGEMEAKYGTEGSDTYIRDPFAREEAIQGAQTSSRMTLGEMLNRAMGVYQSRTAEQEAALGGLGRKYERAMGEYTGDVEEAQGLDAQEAQQGAVRRQVAQQEFENQMAMKQYELALMSAQKSGGRGGGGGGGKKGGGSDFEDFVQNMQDFAEPVTYRQLSREDLGSKLQVAHPNMGKDQIMSYVYSYFPDNSLMQEEGQEQPTQEEGTETVKADWQRPERKGYEDRWGRQTYVNR